VSRAGGRKGGEDRRGRGRAFLRLVDDSTGRESAVSDMGCQRSRQAPGAAQEVGAGGERAKQVAHLAGLEGGDAGLGALKMPNLTSNRLSREDARRRCAKVTDLTVCPERRNESKGPLADERLLTRQQKDATRGETWSASAGTSGRKGFHSGHKREQLLFMDRSVLVLES